MVQRPSQKALKFRQPAIDRNRTNGGISSHPDGQLVQTFGDQTVILWMRTTMQGQTGSFHHHFRSREQNAIGDKISRIEPGTANRPEKALERPMPYEIDRYEVVPLETWFAISCKPIWPHACATLTAMDNQRTRSMRWIRV